MQVIEVGNLQQVSTGIN